MKKDSTCWQIIGYVAENSMGDLHFFIRLRGMNMAEFSMQDVELMISEQRKYFFSGATKKIDFRKEQLKKLLGSEDCLENE